MVKPVSVAELLARIRALLRRPQVFRAEGWLHWREIAMDLAAVRVTRNGREIRLGPTEFRLLKFRMQNPERVFSRQELIEAV
jgi:two-component system phosphate regulon response regulator PhoB